VLHVCSSVPLLVSAMLWKPRACCPPLQALERAKTFIKRVRAPWELSRLEVDYRYAEALERMGRLREAAEGYASLTERYQEHLPDALNHGLMWTSLGRVQLELGHSAEAKASLERALKMDLETDDPVRVAITERELVRAQLALGEPDAALETIAHARTILESEVDADHRLLGILAEEARKMKRQSVSSSGSASKKSGGSSAKEHER